MIKLVYKAFGLLISVLGGLIAGAIFRQVWRALADGDDSPATPDRDHVCEEIAAAAAIEGAVFVSQGRPGPRRRDPDSHAPPTPGGATSAPTADFDVAAATDQPRRHSRDPSGAGIEPPVRPDRALRRTDGVRHHDTATGRQRSTFQTVPTIQGSVRYA